MSDILTSEKKQCPACGKNCGIDDVRCSQCQYEFPTDSQRSNAPTSNNPKAPKKSCPECGAKVYINRAYCDQCNHKFISKKEKELLENHAKQSSITPKTSKSSCPTKALRNISIALVIYGIFLVAIMAILIRHVSPVWFAIIATGTIVISLGVGFIYGILFDGSYGKASIHPFNSYCIIVVLATTLIDILYLTKGISIYSGSLKWGMGAIAVSISVCIVTSLITMKNSLKTYYCRHCDLTNALQFSHDQNEKEIYGYKFETRKGHTETARISRDVYGDSDVYIRYKTPDYQENLGLHKTTTKESIYICEKCGRTVVRNSSITEKVDI